MDTLEVITADISIEDELEFLKVARRNREVRRISQRADINGPIYLSEGEIEDAFQNGNELTFLLWNMSVGNPLCWELFIHDYDNNWDNINREYAKSLKTPNTDEEFFSLFASFQEQPVTNKLFKSGLVHKLLSPVIEVSVPSIKKSAVKVNT